MTIRPILIWPDERLEDVSDDIAPEDVDSSLIADMIDTMESHSGIGLAAPQIGINKRIIVLDKSLFTDDRDSHLVMINPIIIDGMGDKVVSEGCLSLPGIEFFMQRAFLIDVEFQTLAGEKESLSASGILSIAIQHEIDHLNGDLTVHSANRHERRRIKKVMIKRKKNEERRPSLSS